MSGSSVNQPARAEIVVDVAAVRHNVRTLRALVGPGVAMMVVVKADGYGHGIAESRPRRPRRRRRVAGGRHASTRRSRSAPRATPVASCAGSPCRARTTPRAVAADLDVTVYSEAELAEVVAAAGDADRARPDQGRHRAQPRWRGPATPGRRCSRPLAGLERDGRIEVTGIWSHFSSSDEPDDPANAAQEAAFARRARRGRARRADARGPPPRQLRGRDPAAELAARPGPGRHRGVRPRPGPRSTRPTSGWCPR